MKPEMYTDALLRMVMNGTTSTQAVKSLFLHLKARGKQGMLRSIKSHLTRKGMALAHKEEAVLEIARVKDVEYAKKEATTYWDNRTISMPIVRIDESLIGGWRLIGGGTLVDNSFKKHLLEFYKQINV